ncbi:hypothetical protein N9J26_00565 [bacterium]|nr:hypothetical protein [bacterium]
MNNNTKNSTSAEPKDTWFDAMTAVVVVSIFVAACTLWVASQ